MQGNSSNWAALPLWEFEFEFEFKEAVRGILRKTSLALPKVRCPCSLSLSLSSRKQFEIFVLGVVGATQSAV